MAFGCQEKTSPIDRKESSWGRLPDARYWGAPGVFLQTPGLVQNLTLTIYGHFSTARL